MRPRDKIYILDIESVLIELYEHLSYGDSDKFKKRDNVEWLVTSIVYGILTDDLGYNVQFNSELLVDGSVVFYRDLLWLDVTDYVKLDVNRTYDFRTCLINNNLHIIIGE